MTRAEQETTIRWDQEDRTAELWTAYAPDARKWEKAGYTVWPYAFDRDGNPQSWAARVPCEAIRYRQVKDGRVAKRRGHRKGRLLGVSQTDQLVEVEPDTATGEEWDTTTLQRDHQVDEMVG